MKNNQIDVHNSYLHGKILNIMKEDQTVCCPNILVSSIFLCLKYPYVKNNPVFKISPCLKYLCARKYKGEFKKNISYENNFFWRNALEEVFNSIVYNLILLIIYCIKNMLIAVRPVYVITAVYYETYIKILTD